MIDKSRSRSRGRVSRLGIVPRMNASCPVAWLIKLFVRQSPPISTGRQFAQAVYRQELVADGVEFVSDSEIDREVN